MTPMVTCTIVKHNTSNHKTRKMGQLVSKTNKAMLIFIL